MINEKFGMEPFKEEVESEPWTFYEEKKWFDITDTHLGAMVLGRVGTFTGKVEVLDVDGNSGTCELCGGNYQSLEVRVGGELVWSAEENWAFDEDDPSVYAALDRWLKEEN